MEDQQNSRVQVEVGRMSLATLAGGAAIEKFDAELDRVLQNIADINTTGADRSITLKVKFKPDSERSGCKVVVNVSSQMAPEEAFGTQMFIGREGGKPITKAAQVARCGNAVCPPIAEALVRSNMIDHVAETERTAACA